MQRIILEASSYKRQGTASEYEFLLQHHRISKMKTLCYTDPEMSARLSTIYAKDIRMIERIE